MDLSTEVQTRREGATVPAINRTLDESAADHIRNWIIDGTLEPEIRLMEVALSEQLGVSHGPVREAIRRLDREGFVILSPRQGRRRPIPKV
jgi:DNA-binding GntR family transcriptional regulator